MFSHNLCLLDPQLSPVQGIAISKYIILYAGRVGKVPLHWLQHFPSLAQTQQSEQQYTRLQYNTNQKILKITVL